MPAPWWSDYVGLPFQRGGRTRAGIDCWGLVCLVYAEQRQVALPSLSCEYTDARRSGNVGPLVAQQLPDWMPTHPQPFAVALFAGAPGEYHVGVMIDERRMLHAAPGKDCCIQRPQIALMHCAGFFRPRELPCSN